MVEKMSLIGKHYSALPTPCLAVNRRAMEGNLSSLQRFLDSKGKSLRAHAKTHKSSRMAALQLEKGAIGVCAAKLSEAEGLIRHGIEKVLITGPVVSDEAHDRLIRCLGLASDLIVVFDNIENARRVSRKVAPLGRTLRCLIDLDPDFNRTGVPLGEAIHFAHALGELPGLDICGVQAYAGNLQHIASLAQRIASSQSALKAVADVFNDYKSQGFKMDIFSAGGTGTVQADVAIPEVTEIQAGSYVFMDVEYAEIEWGSFLDHPGTFESALYLLSTVVSTNHQGFVTIDAGLKSLYRDGGIPSVIQPAQTGATYEWFGDEYGRVNLQKPDPAFSLGQKIKLSISHVDPTVNLFDNIFVVENETVVDVLPIDLRGCSQ